MARQIEGLVWMEANEEKLAGHGISRVEVEDNTFLDPWLSAEDADSWEPFASSDDGGPGQGRTCVTLELTSEQATWLSRLAAESGASLAGALSSVIDEAHRRAERT